MDFSKPERFLKEIVDFLHSITIVGASVDFKTYKTINGA